MIVPVVLYNGGAPWTAPLDFREMLDGHELFTGLTVSCPYTLINVHSYHQDELLGMSNLIGSVFLLDQATNLPEIIQRLHLLLNTIRQLSEEEFQLFTTWAQHILSRDIPPDQQAQITQVLSHSHPEEVETMISNVERVLKKTLQEAKQEGMEEARLAMARQMLLSSEPIDTIVRYTGLDREKVEGLHNQD